MSNLGCWEPHENLDVEQRAQLLVPGLEFSVFHRGGGSGTGNPTA